jgi:hypothetical protein
VSALFFDSATFGLTGDVTGTFTGGDHTTHSFILDFYDSSLTWAFANYDSSGTRVGGDLGNYTVTATPLPAALPLFATGVGALSLLGWRKRRKAAAALAAA